MSEEVFLSFSSGGEEVEGKESSRFSAIWSTYGSESAEIGGHFGLNFEFFWVIFAVLDGDMDKEDGGADGFGEKVGEREQSAIEIGGIF